MKAVSPGAIPIVRSDHVDPLFVRLMPPMRGYPNGYLIVGRKVCLRALLFDALLTDSDREFLKDIRIGFFDPDVAQ